MSCIIICMRIIGKAVLLPMLLLFLPAMAAAADLNEILRHSIENNEQNWKMAPQFTYTEHDVTTKNDRRTERTFKVLMIEGSPYNELIAEDGRPLTKARSMAERKKLKMEIARRTRESPSARRKRIAAYQQNRHQEQALMHEMTNAFNFKLIGQETLNGHRCYVLDAEPRPEYRPASYETKVLTGMRGKMWIDMEAQQWVKVQAKVFRPVAFGLFIAHVEPGTEFILEQSPVERGIWLPSRFITKVRANELFFWSKNYSEDQTNSNYRRAGSDAPGLGRN